MLTLNDGRKEMYQWDVGRIATIDVECDVVHFSNLKYGASLSVEVKNGKVAIPNKLLTSGEPIYCWAFVADENGNYTKQEQTLNVNKRAKPSDYVYTETETLTWKSLDERITELEKGGTGGGGGSGDMLKSVYDPNGNEKDIFKYAYDISKLAVTNHALSDTAHTDIRELITGLTNRLNALADSDDTTLDQMSEIVAYIKSNKSLIDAITTNKISVSDIVDNLTSSATNKPLSAAQGKALKTLIDAIVIPDKLPNPNALTFTGAVTGSYDGSAPLTVDIPRGGGGESTEMSLLATYVITPSDKNIMLDMASYGVNHFLIEYELPVKTSNKTNLYIMNAAAIGTSVISLNDNAFYGFSLFKIVDSCIYGVTSCYNGYSTPNVYGINGATRNINSDKTSILVQIYPFVDGDEELTIKIWGWN